MPLEQTNPYLVVPNSRTGRLEFYEEVRKGCERLVGSIPDTDDNAVILAFCGRLREEVR